MDLLILLIFNTQEAHENPMQICTFISLIGFCNFFSSLQNAAIKSYFNNRVQNGMAKSRGFTPIPFFSFYNLLFYVLIYF